MKHLSVIISVLLFFSAFCIGCIKELWYLEKQMMFRMSIRSGFWSIHRIRKIVYSTNLPGNVEAYLFKEESVEHFTKIWEWIRTDTYYNQPIWPKESKSISL